MSEVLHRTKDEIQEIAAKQGMVAVIPLPNELQLDIDSPGATLQDLNQEVVAALADNGIIFIGHLITKSKSGNTHIHLGLNKELDQGLRIALQAALGSDPVREALAVCRKREGSDTPCVLFESRLSAIKVDLWRNS